MYYLSKGSRKGKKLDHAYHLLMPALLTTTLRNLRDGKNEAFGIEITVVLVPGARCSWRRVSLLRHVSRQAKVQLRRQTSRRALDLKAAHEASAALHA